MSKVIFLDVDGTLMNNKGVVPDSAKEALRRTKEKGNEIVVCTGRCRCQVDERLLSLDFDGIVASAGAYVERHGEIVRQRLIPQDKHRKMAQYMQEHDIILMTQCTHGVFISSKDYDRCVRWLEERNLTEEKKAEFLDTVEVDDSVLQTDKAEKYLFMDSKLPFEELKRGIGDFFTAIPPSYESGNGTSGEINETNVTKASGMEHYLAALGKTREDSVAVGDGPNDVEMMEYAGTSVAMGNGVDEVRELADLVTTHIDEDGIYNAFLKLRLI